MLKIDHKNREFLCVDSFFFDDDEIFHEIHEEEHLGIKENFFVHFNRKVVYQRCSDERRFGEKYHLTYKFVKNDTKLIKKILDGHGFEQLHPASSIFNLLWTSSSIKFSTYQTLLPFQRVNHFPKSSELTRKDRLYQNLQKMQQDKGLKHFDFIPTTFILPKQYEQFQTTWEKEKGIWIVKPIASSQGRGIFLINNVSNVPKDGNLVVSRYISNPLLIDGFKFDVRMYVAVTSFDPLVIYLYQEGLTRFATIKYDRNNENLSNNFMHLTNYSVNKENNHYVRCDDPDVEDYGNKWTMSAMLRLLKSEGKDTFCLMMAIEDLIIKTFLSVQNQIANACQIFVPHRSNCFEIYGFDILIDDQLKPWLIEVNLSPSLNCDAPIDLKVKSALICDLFNLISIPALNVYQYLNNESRRIRLNETESKSKTDEMSIIKRLEDENIRCGNFLRIYPCEEMFEYFSSYLPDEKVHLNETIHQYFYPNRWKKSSSDRLIHQRKSHHRNHLQRSKYLSAMFHLAEKNSSIVKNTSELIKAIQRCQSYHKTSLQSNIKENLFVSSSLNRFYHQPLNVKLISSSTERLHLCENDNRKSLLRVSSAPKEPYQKKFSRKPPLDRSSRAISSISKERKTSSRFFSSSFSNDESHPEDFADQLNEISTKQHRRQYTSVSHLNTISTDQQEEPIEDKQERIILLEKTDEILQKNEVKKVQIAKQAKLFREKLRRNEIYSALHRYSHIPASSAKAKAAQISLGESRRKITN